MTIVHSCTYCGSQITAPDSFAGQEICCPDCGEEVQLQDSLEADDLVQTSLALTAPSNSAPDVTDQRVHIRCDECFQRYLVPPSDVDLEFDCPRCQHTFLVSASALQVGGDPEAGGERNLKTADAFDATLGDEMLVELSSLDQEAIEGAPLQQVRHQFAWLPGPLRHRAVAALAFVAEHPIAIAVTTVVIGAWTLVLLYYLG